MKRMMKMKVTIEISENASVREILEAVVKATNYGGLWCDDMCV